MTLQELGAYFVETGCATAPGTDLFYGQLPEAPDACAALVELGGGDGVSAFGGLHMEQVSLQVFVRGASYLTARQVAEDYYRAVLALRNRDVSGVFYHNAEPGSPPYYFDRDDRDRPVFLMPFEVWKALS